MKEEFTIENSQIEIIFKTDKTQIKHNLINIYNIINKIANNCKNIDTTKWFYKIEDIEKMKQSGKYNFL